MKIAVIGAGAIGGLVAGAFAEAGHDVSIVARGAHLAAIQASGLTVRWLDRDARTYPLPGFATPEALGVQDAVFITLKAYSIGPLLPRLAGMLGPDTAIVPAINGLPWWYFARHPGPHRDQPLRAVDPDGSMLAALDPAHIVGCVVHGAAEVVEPGVVQHTSGRLFVLGEIDGAMTARLDRLGDAMRRGGLEPRLTRTIRNEVWMKLIGNLSYNPVAALTLSRMNEINDDPALIRMIRAQMREAMAVAEAYGEPITLSIDERLAIARKIGNSKISMHQDLERGRPLEIAAIVSAVLELAGRAGIETPMIDAVHALASARARVAARTSGGAS